MSRKLQCFDGQVVRTYAAGLVNPQELKGGLLHGLFTVCDGCDSSLEHGGYLSSLLVDIHRTGEDLQRMDFCIVCGQKVTVEEVEMLASLIRGTHLQQPEPYRKRLEALRAKLRGDVYNKKNPVPEAVGG